MPCRTRTENHYLCATINLKKNMKRCHALIVLFLLLAPSLYMSLRSYEQTRQELLSDMNQALAKTLEQQRSAEITPDTIQNYLAHLQVPVLREHSFVYYTMESRGGEQLCSDSLRWSDGHGTSCDFQSFASVTPLSIWLMSDQRLASLFLLLTAAWGLYTAIRFRRGLMPAGVHVGRLTLADGKFYNEQRQRVRLTPMQEQVLTMFFMADGNTLAKQDICDALWPKKPDASETLYTLIKRLRPIVEEQGALQISSQRGGEYTLQERK